MENLAKIILYENIESDKLIHKIFHYTSDFFDTYKQTTENDKITAYVPYKITIKEEAPDILILREKLLLLLRDYADLILNSKQEFAGSYKDKFCIIKVIGKTQIELFLSYCMFYYFDSLHSDKKLLVGLDYEFSNNNIRLHQIAFYPLRKFKYIFILDPTFLDSYQMDLYIKTIYISSMYKITHGSESLDLPYIYSMFKSNNQNFQLFINSMIDTRFLCEFIKISNEENNKKCSIYDALLFFKVIRTKKYNMLNDMNELMGPIQNVKWDINKLSDTSFKYALYDVIYLRRFLFNMFKHSSKISKQLNLIIAINRYVTFEKYGLLNIIPKTKDLIDPLNNYIVESPDSKNKITMNEFFNKVINKIKIKTINLKIKNLLDVEYFKKILILIFKRIIYSIITQKYKIYIDNNKIYENKITFKEIYQSMLDFGLNKFVFLLDEFYKEAIIEIINFF
jgi:hypothetical protein